VSAETSTPPPAGDAEAVARQCPRCGAALKQDQEWCLSCGTGVGAVVAAPRGWRWPVAIVAALLALALAAFVLALVELAGNAEQVGQQPAATATPAPVAAATPTAAPTTDPNAVPPATGGTGAATAIPEWPAGKTGYTVVLESSSTRSAAEARATDLAGQGISAGVLDSSGYATLTPDRFVVFSGQYDTRAEARRALAGLAGRAQGAKVARVAPA
jgi:septal ring-binding cell division protein DamX